MKTVQEWLRKLDTEKLIEEYLYIDPIQYDRHESYLNRTVGEIKHAYKECVRKYIERLRTISVAEPEDGHQGSPKNKACVALLQKLGFTTQAIGWMLNEGELDKDLDQLFSTIVFQKTIDVEDKMEMSN